VGASFPTNIADQSLAASRLLFVGCEHHFMCCVAALAARQHKIVAVKKFLKN